MPNCDICHRPVSPKDPFCISCGQSRIVESLHIAASQPFRFNHVLRVGMAVVGIWLIITIGVAFLREAKALRRAREALTRNDAKTAHEWVYPFVKKHQNNVEALYLTGESSIKLRKDADAEAYYVKLSNMTNSKAAQERSGRLKAIYQQQLPINAAHLQCGQSAFATFYESYGNLDDDFHDTLVQSGAGLARKCVASQDPRVANEPGYWLIYEKKMAPEAIVTTLYIEPFSHAVANKEYQLAQHLARQGMSLWPQARLKVDQLLAETRGRVAKTIEEMNALYTAVTKEHSLHRGYSTCFPASLPETGINRSDGWGNPLTYTPFEWNQTTQCHGGFELRSMGADAAPTPHDTTTPAMEFTYSYHWGRLQQKTPDTFWRPRK